MPQIFKEFADRIKVWHPTHVQKPWVCVWRAVIWGNWWGQDTKANVSFISQFLNSISRRKMRNNKMWVLSNCLLLANGFPDLLFIPEDWDRHSSQRCVNLYWTTHYHRNKDRVVSIGTSYWLGGREVGVRVLLGSRIFSSPHPNQPWGPPNLLSNGYQCLFPWW
jgi:hypothetical protein